ncbi:hypothetical protein [Actinomyces sp. oral taxon 181]|uniref:hypothetical protein n=1 Tax=Actinomyces sp. oral taxon 181 TaxID=712121 RepID=UPI0002A33BB1|nr:hypothetical protein [Actinomyces sp. oral taxon 181]EKY14394.1 hypothetical protein HMPREF9061_01358 [Actinomyces sp. oral taxon 181 str. F0379]
MLKIVGLAVFWLRAQGLLEERDAMSKSLRSLALLCAAITLLTGCIPFGSNGTRTRLPQDPRFSKFTYETDGEIKVQNRIDSFNERMPGLGATQGHVVAANFPEGWLLPSPDHHLWVTGVASVPPETIQMLANGSDGNNALLPGIYPGLYEYVPQNCHFFTVPSDHANTVLQTDKNNIYSNWGSFDIASFAASSDCNLIIVTGEGIRG